MFSMTVVGYPSCIQVRPYRPNMKITHARIAAFYRSFNALLDTGLLLIE